MKLASTIETPRLDHTFTAPPCCRQGQAHARLSFSEGIHLRPGSGFAAHLCGLAAGERGAGHRDIAAVAHGHSASVLQKRASRGVSLRAASRASREGKLAETAASTPVSAAHLGFTVCKVNVLDRDVASIVSMYSPTIST